MTTTSTTTIYTSYDVLMHKGSPLLVAM